MKRQGLKLLVPATLFCCFVAGAQSQTVLTEITTTDGRTYRNVTVQRADPDGLIVNYQLEQPGLGVAKLKFRNLPESLRNQYGYEAAKAADFENQQTQATIQWRNQLAVENSFQQYRALAELNRSLGGDFYSSYSISMDATGKLSAQGFTGNVLPYPAYFSWDLPWNSALSSGLQLDRSPKAGTTRPNGY